MISFYLNIITLLGINGIFAVQLKNIYNISTIFTVAIASLLLIVSSFGNAITHNQNNIYKKEARNKPENKPKGNKQIVSSLSIEAVISPVIEAFALNCVIFQPVEFKFFISNNVFSSFRKFFKSQVFEILFEHLAAPNAP